MTLQTLKCIMLLLSSMHTVIKRSMYLHTKKSWLNLGSHLPPPSCSAPQALAGNILLRKSWSHQTPQDMLSCVLWPSNASGRGSWQYLFLTQLWRYQTLQAYAYAYRYCMLYVGNGCQTSRDFPVYVRFAQDTVLSSKAEGHFWL